MLEEFKRFVLGSNMVDMAIGIVIGAAFGAIVGSLVEDILLSPIVLLMGGIDFSSLFGVLKEGSTAALYASLAVSIFLVIKLLNKVRSNQEETIEPSVELLAEISDLLRDQRR